MEEAAGVVDGGGGDAACSAKMISLSWTLTLGSAGLLDQYTFSNPEVKRVTDLLVIRELKERHERTSLLSRDLSDNRDHELYRSGVTREAYLVHVQEDS